MEARHNVHKREAERDIALAWHIVAFDRQKTLKGLPHYLSPRSSEGQSAAEMVEMLEHFRAKGAAIDIRRLH